MKLTEEVEYELPDAPTELRLKDTMFNRKLTKDFTDEELEYIAERWRKQLFKGAGRKYT